MPRVQRRNIEANLMRNITVEAKAISDQNGKLQFTLGHSVARGDESIPTTTVLSVTIDSLTEQYGSPDLVIIDVEGFEGRAIRGAGRTLDSQVIWCVEVHSNCGLESFGGTSEEIVGSFQGRGYQLMMCRDYGSDLPVAFECSAPLVRERFHLVAIPATG